ncbi:PASTA domain-containing protein [Streptococcus sp. 2A/TPW/M5]
MIVSKGPNSFEMPNYVGETRAKAEEDLKNTYKVSSKMITIEEVETFDYAAGTVLEQTPAPGKQYSLSSKTKIVLKVAKETTSIEMPNYVGSTYDFARSNLIEIYGIKESNIKIRKTNHLPDGVSVSAGQIVSQTPEVSSTVDINRTRIVLTVYEPNEGGQNRNRVEPNDNYDDSNSKVNDTGNSSSGYDD